MERSPLLKMLSEKTAHCFSVTLCLIMSFCSITAYGQKNIGLSLSSDPYYGTVRLSEYFTPDPHTVRVLSGGNINLANLNLCYDCTGYAASAPDLRLYWSGDSDDLSIFFVADNNSSDATLIINTPDGTWIGNDDYNSITLNPGVSLYGFGEGRYDIWVGSFSAEDQISGTLSITELDEMPEMTGHSLNISGTPHFGEVSLSEFFTPDPYTVNVVSGGSVNVNDLGLCGDCIGFASNEPDFRLHWDGSSDDLSIFFEADDSTSDATIIINTPDGTWIGNDDAGSSTLNPKLSLLGFGAGVYDIWIGSYSSDNQISGTLSITELDNGPE